MLSIAVQGMMRLHSLKTEVVRGLYELCLEPLLLFIVLLPGKHKAPWPKVIPLAPRDIRIQADECEKRVLLGKRHAVPASWHCPSSALPGIRNFSLNFVSTESLVIVVAKHQRIAGPREA